MACDGVILQNPRVDRHIGAAQVLPQSLCHVNKHSHLCGMFKPGESSAMEQFGSVSRAVIASESLRAQRANAANNTAAVLLSPVCPSLRSFLSFTHFPCFLSYPTPQSTAHTQHTTYPYPKPSHTPIFTYLLHATPLPPPDLTTQGRLLTAPTYI